MDKLQNQKNTIEQRLLDITDMLIINGVLIDCPGLIRGKMGVVIYFFNYARYTMRMISKRT